jgi:AcrR family transcriptional regulator
MKIKDEKKVDIIFDATLDLISEKGISGTSIDLIAKKSKLATGTIYIYFQNKEDLINKLYIHTKKNFYSSLLEGYNEKDPFKISLKKIWLNLLNVLRIKYRETIFHDQYYHSPYSKEENIKLSQDSMLPLIELLEKGKREGLIKEVDNILILTYIYGGIRELTNIKKYTSEYYFSDEVIEKYFMICWDGIKA